MPSDTTPSSAGIKQRELHLLLVAMPRLDEIGEMAEDLRELTRLLASRDRGAVIFGEGRGVQVQRRREAVPVEDRTTDVEQDGAKDFGFGLIGDDAERMFDVDLAADERRDLPCHGSKRAGADLATAKARADVGRRQCRAFACRLDRCRQQRTIAEHAARGRCARRLYDPARGRTAAINRAIGEGRHQRSS